MSPLCVTRSKTKARKVPPHSEPRFAEGWAFVNVSEPKQSKDKSLRKVVRAQAMRDYRQRKRQDEIKHQKQPEHLNSSHEVDHLSLLLKSGLPIPAQTDDDGRCFLSYEHASWVDSCRYSASRIRSSPKQLLGDRVIDPFDASPMGGDSQYKDYILHHCELPSYPLLKRTCNPISTQPLTLQ